MRPASKERPTGGRTSVFPSPQEMTVSPVRARRPRRLRAGDLVEVRSAEEILATLGPDATVDGLPFQPEMLAYAGARLTVDKRADTTCFSGVVRRLESAVHLTGVRCDGSAHGGCQNGCLMYWKEEWLRPVDPRAGKAPGVRMAAPVQRAGCERADVVRAVHPPETGPDGEELWSCQATQVRAATTRIPAWDLRHFVTDVRNRNLRWWTLVRSVPIYLVNVLQSHSRGHLPPWLRVAHGQPVPFVHGRLTRTPSISLDLEPGETVRIRSRKEIRETLDRRGRNRGLSFDIEMVPYCGQTRRVEKVITRFIDAWTGRMITPPRRSVVLEGTACQGRYHGLCQRQDLQFWREAWLTREPAPDGRAAAHAEE